MVVSLLIGLLVLPWMLQFQHVLAAHEHPTCEIADHHFHTADNSCDFPDYTLGSSFTLAEAYEMQVSNMYAQKKVYYTAPVLEFLHIKNQSQRGPPQFL
jgi:hypothetical protein